MSSCHIALFRPLRLRRLSLSLALALGCTVAVHAQAPAGAAATPGPAAAGAAHVQLWHAATRDAIARTKPNQQAALRLLAYLSLAQSEAAQAVQATAATTADAAWNAAFDGASAELLSSLAPTQKPVWEGLAASLATARGEDDPSVAAAFSAARTAATEAARRVAARAAADGFNETWKGTAPESANAWRSQLQPARPPHLPQLAHMKPIFVASADALGAPPPPQPGDAKFASDLAEVRARAGSAGAAGLARAKRWEMTSGSLVAGFWDETAVELARREGLSGPETARALALVMGATMDANIACHKVKYTHWVPRPSQADPSIRTLIGLPNHPSYPSNHSCDSMAAATVLGRLFPRHHPALEAMAHEAGESRVDGGIHYRFDVEAGEGIGRAAAAAALKAAGATTVAEQRP